MFCKDLQEIATDLVTFSEHIKVHVRSEGTVFYISPFDPQKYVQYPRHCLSFIHRSNWKWKQKVTATCATNWWEFCFCPLNSVVWENVLLERINSSQFTVCLKSGNLWRTDKGRLHSVWLWLFGSPGLWAELWPPLATSSSSHYPCPGCAEQIIDFNRNSLNSWSSNYKKCWIFLHCLFFLKVVLFYFI